MGRRLKNAEKLSTEMAFIDETKLEACANKYGLSILQQPLMFSYRYKHAFYIKSNTNSYKKYCFLYELVYYFF